MLKKLAFFLVICTGVACADPAVPQSYLNTVKSMLTFKHPVESKRGGGATGKVPFSDMGPGDGLLTGFSVTCAMFMGGNIIQSVQPIFLAYEGPGLGTRHGVNLKGSKTSTIEAKEGYAVGGIHMRAGMFVNGFSVTFMKVQNGSLNPRISYESEWVGDQQGGGQLTLAGDGALVVGMCGNDSGPEDRSGRICGMGLLVIPLPAVTPKRGK